MVNDLKFFLKKNKKTSFTGGTSPGEEKVSDEYTEPSFGFGSLSESRSKLQQLRQEAAQAHEEKERYYLTPDGLEHARREQLADSRKQRKRTTYLNRRRLEREDQLRKEAANPIQALPTPPTAVHTPPENLLPDVGACLALAQKTNRVDWYTFSPTCENLNRKQKRKLSRKLSILQAIFRGNMERKKISEIPKLVQNEDLDQLAMRKKVFRERKQDMEAKEKLDKLIAKSKVEYESDFVNKRILPGSVGKPNIMPDGWSGDMKSGPRNSRRYNTSNSEMDYNISKNFVEPNRKIIKEGPFEYIYKNDKNIVDEPLQPMSIYANVEEELKKHNQKISEKLDKFYIADMELYKKIRNIERQKEDKDGFLDEDGKEVELDPEQKEFLEKYKKFKKDNAEGETVIVDTPNNTKYELYIEKNGLVTVLKYIDENGLITDFNEKDEYEDSQDQTGGSNNDKHLFDALENNDLEQMRVAIESGANVNVQSSRGASPLIYLAKGYYYPNAEIVDLLLTNNANPNLQDRGGETALHWAASRGFLEIVKKLLESENIDINITNIDGRNALHGIFDDDMDLFYLEHVETIMKLLIEKGININETDNSGKTALHLAAEQNHGNAVGILLRAGADENIKTDDYHPAGQTAYELAKNKKNRIELDRHNSLGEIIPGGDLVERLRITQIEPDLVRAVMTVGEEEHSFQIPRDILVDTDHNLWTYEPLALNAFHEFHREKAQAYLAERGQAGITASYLSEEAKNEDSILNSLPHDLEKRISKMLGGGQIFSSNKKDYELEFLNNELSKTRKRYNTYGKLLAVNKLIPKNVDNDIWDYAMKKYTFFKKNYYEFRSPNNVLDLAVHQMEWLGDWIDEDTLAAMIKVFNILSVLPPNIHYANSASVLEIKQSIEYALNINSNPQRVLIALLRSQAFLIEYYFFMLNHGISRDRRFNITINKLNSIFTEIYKKKNYELSLYKTIHENPFLSYYEQREMSKIIESVIFYKEIATESLKIIYELFEEHDKYIFVYLKEQSQKNDETEKKQDRIKMYKLTNRRKKFPSHWSKHYKTNESLLPEIIETKIDENLL